MGSSKPGGCSTYTNSEIGPLRKALKIQTFDLCVALSNQPCFVSCYHAMFILFVSKDPFGSNEIRFMPPQLHEIGFHVENHATQWHGFQHEIQLQEVVVAWI